MLRSTVLALALVPLASHAQKVELPTRFTVPTYLVSTNSGVAEELLTWKNLLQSDMSALSGEIGMLPNAGRIRFRERPQQSAPTQATIEERWDQLNAIQVITAIGALQGGSTVMEGSIYLGDLAAGMSSRSVPLPPTLDARSYQVSRDTVKAATLFALANDAAAENRPVACQLLRRASQARNDLARRGGAPRALSNAIDARHSSLQCGIVR